MDDRWVWSVNKTLIFFARVFSTVVTADWTYNRCGADHKLEKLHFFSSSALTPLWTLLLPTQRFLQVFWKSSLARLTRSNNWICILCHFLCLWSNNWFRILFRFPNPGNFLAVCAALTASHPTSCPPKGSPGWYSNTLISVLVTSFYTLPPFCTLPKKTIFF